MWCLFLFLVHMICTQLSQTIRVAVRTALVALIAFMPTNPGGALGSLDYKKEDRRALAIKSRETPPKFGSPERQSVIDEVKFPTHFEELKYALFCFFDTKNCCKHRSMSKCSVKLHLFLNC